MASEQQLRAAARQHALTAAHLQGQAIAARAIWFANALKWGRPTRIHEVRGSVVLQFSAGLIEGNISTGRVVIYPAN